jgi:ERCC4-related helicase
MTQFYLYASDPADILEGKLNFAVDIRTDAPEDFEKYCAGVFICSVDVDMDKHLDRIRDHAAEVLNQKLALAKSQSDKKCQEIQTKIQRLANTSHQPIHDAFAGVS